MRVIATAGHVDHGKSALLRALTTMEPDRWDEERRRGLTIDLGFVWTDLAESLTVAFVDVPGHDSFLPNMLCGVGVVDEVLFVVAADDGWSAQSQEHLEILSLLHRRCVAAVVTKAALAGPDRVAEVIEDVRHHLAPTSLGDAPVLAVDSLTGAGIDDLRTVLVDRLTQGAAEERSRAADATRLWIDRSFTIRGAGTVVTGMLSEGSVQVGQEIEIAPGARTGRIRSLQALERPVDQATAPMRVAINLTGIEHGDISRGDVLVSRGNRPREVPTSALDAQLQALPSTGIGRRGAWHLHLGTAVSEVRVLPLLEDLEPGTSGPVRLELARPFPVRAGDRFVVRDAGRHRTAGGGVVLDPAPAGRQRGTERRLAHALVLEELTQATDPIARTRGLVDAHGGVRERSQVTAIVGTQVADDELLVIGDHLVRSDRSRPWRDAVAARALQAPTDRALDPSDLIPAARAVGCPPSLAPALIDHLVDTGALHRVGGRIVHPDHAQRYLTARDERRDRFLEELRQAWLEPPDPTAVAQELQVPSFEVQSMVDDGVVVACGPLLFVPEAIAAAADVLRAGPGRDGATFSASEARQAWATNRRCAMPLLDHLRAIGVTTFDGDQHQVTHT
jgi:selenocysteine-specific elongation factor